MIETQTIDIRHVQLVLQNCPNYDYIVNYDYDYGDVLSSKLIDWYREFIFKVNGNNKEELETIKEIDRSMFLYVKDNKYKRGLSDILKLEEISIDNQGLVMGLIRKIINFTKNYEDKKVLEISISKWL